MKKSIFLFFAALLCAVSTNAKTIYFKPSDNWKEADAWFQVWDGSNDHAFTETTISGLYQADIKDNATEIYIKRKQPNTNNNWDEGSKTTIGSYNYFYNIDWSNQMGKTSIIGLVTGGHIYFDNLETQWTGNIQFVVGHDSYSRTYEMNQISNTHLWYVNLTDKDNHTWGDAKYYGFIASGSKFGDGGWGSSNLKNATSYTKAYTSTYSLNDGAIYYCKMSATANGSTFSIDYKGSKNDIPKYDATQAAKVRNSKTDAYTDINGTWPATLKLEGTYLDNNSTAKRSDITSTTSTDEAINRVYEAVRSGKVTHTYANLSEDYHFEGWGTADAPTSADASYEYNITENTTVYAFFTKKYPVNFSADANGSVIATADEQALTSGNKVVGGTEVTLTATANDGYEFVNWTKAGEEVSTEATYSLTVTENVDLVANFELKTYTVEFLNYDGEVLQSSTVNHGETPVYSGKTPERPADEQYTYTFSDWDNAIAAATSDQTYKAQFNTTVNQYTIIVNAEYGTVTGAGTYDYGTNVTLTATANPGYEFIGWSNGETANPYTFTVTEDVDLVANFAKEAYTRTTTIDSYGTICLPFGSDNYSGAEFYEVAYLVEGTGLWLDQLTAGDQLVAGKPYIFKATATELVVVSNATEVADPVAGANGLTGTFTDIAAGGLTGNYIIAENQVWRAGTGATLSANRAYIDASLVPTTTQAQLPGRRRVCMGENAATGLDNITNGENTTIKVIENGQLIIIRKGEKFNAQGVRF